VPDLAGWNIPKEASERPVYVENCGRIVGDVVIDDDLTALRGG
jgi:hypothetical protein